MKQKFILIFLFFFVSLTPIFSQSIPNPGFENWTTKYTMPFPRLWYSGDTATYLRSGIIQAQKTSDSHSGKYAIKFLPAAQEGIYNNFKWNGTVYKSKPDSISFSYKSNLRLGDSSWIDIRFTFRNISLSSTRIKIAGIHSNWVDTTLPIKYSSSVISPDTIFFDAGAPVFSEEYVILDDIKFIGKGSVDQLPDNSFEQWDSAAYEDPDNWQSDNIKAKIALAPLAITKSSDAHSGNNALKIETTNFKINTWTFGNLLDTLGYINIGTLDYKGKLIRGFPCNTRPKGLSFYYKYTPASVNDRANAAIYIRKGGKNLDSTIVKLYAASSYTLYHITLPDSFSNIPDSIDIAFASSNVYGSRNRRYPYDSIVPGSVLLVDDLAFDTTTSIDQDNSDLTMLNVFPNPAHGKLYIQCYKTGNEPIDFIIRDMPGKEVLHRSMNIKAEDNNAYPFDIGNLPAGIYIFTARTAKGIKSGKMVLE